jgi:hypothetical protein
MADHLTCSWTGASGKMYIYEIYARHPKLPPNEPGNFIYAKLDEHRRWLPIYIGEGNFTQRATPDARAAACIDAKGATHVHLHVNYEREDRVAEVKDLLDNFPQACTPRRLQRKEGSLNAFFEEWSAGYGRTSCGYCFLIASFAAASYVP